MSFTGAYLRGQSDVEKTDPKTPLGACAGLPGLDLSLIRFKSAMPWGRFSTLDPLGFLRAKLLQKETRSVATREHHCLCGYLPGIILGVHVAEIWDSHECRMIMLRQFRSQLTCAELTTHIKTWVVHAVTCTAGYWAPATDALHPKPKSLRNQNHLKPEPQTLKEA